MRPDICIGTDDYHTPAQLQQTALEAFGSLGWRVWLNRPYAGTMVPWSFYGKDARVHPITVEVNRSLYMNEDAGERSAGFGAVRRKVQLTLGAIITSVR
ncbi:MAG TPA: N-formylglutamate amidohydrolase [Anaerolineae bacterium]|nr:N-formylglutamate amidohydrolase [Anaerolineae bacterium]